MSRTDPLAAAIRASLQRAAIAPVMSLRPMAADSSQYELLIYGDIGPDWWGESVTAQRVVEQLVGLDDAVSQINVRINSYGGSVSDGLAIYNALKRHPAEKVVSVDGVAMSIASLIAMAGDRIEMPATSLLMIHAPWGGLYGNAIEMRQYADLLDTYSDVMVDAYAQRSSLDRDAVMALLKDGKDHYYTGAQAVEAGFADAVVEPGADESDPEDEGAQAFAATLLRRYAGGMNRQTADMAVAAALRTPLSARRGAASHRDEPLHPDEDSTMKHRLNRLQNKATDLPTGGGAAAAEPNTPAAPQQAPAAAAPAAGGPDRTAILAAERQRREDIRARFTPYANRTDINVAALQRECEDNPEITPEAACTRLLALLGQGAEPLNGRRAEAGADERDKVIEQCVNALMARAGNFLNAQESERARQGNPFAGKSLISLAEASLIRAGVNTRGMDNETIAKTVFAQQGTSDFPVLLENTLHKMLQTSYSLAAHTWSRFCAIGSLSDYRPHPRYHGGGFDDLLPVNEHGEYVNGTLADGEKEMIAGSRVGRILQLTPEVLRNDDLGFLATRVRKLGQGAYRTIEKDVYALIALNGGNGPTMSDGKALFHADHNNIAATAAVPTVESIDAGRQLMARQMDVGSKDFLDLVPALSLSPLSLGSKFRELNAMEFNDESQKNQRRPNVVRGLLRDVIDTPRLTGNAWFLFADPSQEPVIEVAFLDGVQTPTIEQEVNFHTDGFVWKVVHRYGVGGVGYRGAIKNAGA